MSPRTALFLVQTDNSLQNIKPSAPAKEDDLQQLLEEHPELIAENDESLLLINREHGVPDALSGADRWSIDHAFVTRDAVPVLVEVKRAANTQIRREIVGQMLDYAANGVVYWPADSLRQSFEAYWQKKDGSEPEVKLADFLREGSGPAEFWKEVEANLRAGRVKLLFVADSIPPELARIVEFMNDQMSAEVRAIELSYFEGNDGTRILVPRIIGQSEKARVIKEGGKGKLEPLTIDQWLSKHIEPQGLEVLKGAKRLVEIMQELTANVRVASTQGSILCNVEGADGKPSYPLFLTKSGRAQIAFGWLGGSPAFSDEALRKRFYDRFSDAVGPLSSTNLRGFPSFSVTQFLDDDLLNRFRTVAADFVEKCKGI